MLRGLLQPPLRSPLYPATAPRASSSLTELVRAIYAVSGRVGFMGDTQDLSTMYTTRAGSTLIGTPGNGTAQFVGRWLDKSGGGHHALAPNDTTGRPQLSARVNLLTYTEDFSNAAWAKFNAPVVTANTIQSTTSGAYRNIQQVAAYPIGGSVVAYCRVLKTTSRTAYGGMAILFTGGTTKAAYAIIDEVAATVSTAGASSTAASVSVQVIDNGATFDVVLSATDNGANTAVSLIHYGTLSNFPTILSGADAGSVRTILRSDLRPTNIHAAGSVPAYQRVTAAEDYDSAGFPFRFIPNGTGQAFQTSTITPGSDVVTVVAGVRKTSDAALQIVAEHTASLAANNGAWYLSAPNAASASMAFSSKGTAAAAAATSSLTAPLTRVLTGTGKISTDTCALALNGAASSTDATDQGTGGYSAAVTNLFARGGASNWFGGQAFRYAEIYGTLTPAETATLEAWVNESTKAY